MIIGYRVPSAEAMNWRISFAVADHATATRLLRLMSWLLRSRGVSDVSISASSEPPDGVAGAALTAPSSRKEGDAPMQMD